MVALAAQVVQAVPVALGAMEARTSVDLLYPTAGPEAPAEPAVTVETLEPVEMEAQAAVAQMSLSPLVAR